MAKCKSESKCSSTALLSIYNNVGFHYSKGFRSYVIKESFNFDCVVKRIGEMEKVIRIVKKGQDDGNVLYWLSLSVKERMSELEKIRQQINNRRYGVGQGFQRIYRITKRTQS